MDLRVVRTFSTSGRALVGVADEVSEVPELASIPVQELSRILSLHCQRQIAAGGQQNQEPRHRMSHDSAVVVDFPAIVEPSQPLTQPS